MPKTRLGRRSHGKQHQVYNVYHHNNYNSDRNLRGNITANMNSGDMRFDGVGICSGFSATYNNYPAEVIRPMMAFNNHRVVHQPVSAAVMDPVLVASTHRQSAASDASVRCGKSILVNSKLRRAKTVKIEDLDSRMLPPSPPLPTQKKLKQHLDNNKNDDSNSIDGFVQNALCERLYNQRISQTDDNDYDDDDNNNSSSNISGKHGDNTAHQTSSNVHTRKGINKQDSYGRRRPNSNGRSVTFSDQVMPSSGSRDLKMPTDARRDIFIGQIPLGVDRNVVLERFSPYGFIDKCILKYGGWQLYAFIKYARPEYAARALKAENGKMFGGSFLHVEYVKNLNEDYHTFTHRIRPTGVITFYCCNSRTGQHRPGCRWNRRSSGPASTTSSMIESVRNVQPYGGHTRSTVHM